MDKPDIPATANAAPPSCKPAGRPRASELEARIDNLIHSAGQLFITHGYNKVSLEMIAREAHVAVRTIYVKFGGKAGLLQAVLLANRARFFNVDEMATDPRPVRAVIDEFGEHLFALLSKPEAIAMQRMVIADAPANPELAQTFYETGPKETQNMLARYFARPEIRAQLHPDVEIASLPLFLVNCISGDPFRRLLFAPDAAPWEQALADLHQRLALFYRAALA